MRDLATAGRFSLSVAVAGLLVGAAVAAAPPLLGVKPAVPAQAGSALEAFGATQPISATSGDFDGDGVVDLVCGYTGPGGHAVAIHRGNIDAIFPHRPEARARRVSGTSLAEPFEPASRVHEVTERPDLLVAGDFDADDQWDVVVASRGGHSLQFLAGRGGEGLLAPQSRLLEGSIAALVAGQVNRADSLLDFVVGVHGAGGSVALVFEGPEGAWRSAPERLSLEVPAQAIALGRVEGDLAIDVIVAAGKELLIFEGRDRRLTSTSKRRAEVLPPRVTRRPIEDRVQVLEAAWGGLDSPTQAALNLPAPPIASLPMRLNPDALTDFVLLLDDAPVSMAVTSVAATITVNSTADDEIAGDGSCTLREAINNSNSDTDTTSGDCDAGAGADAIGFSIGGGGASAFINITTELPAISDQVTLNGNTQACESPPCIEIRGGLTMGARGLTLSGGSTVVRGLVINNFDEHGILIESSGNFIEADHIGTEGTATSPEPNGLSGIRVLAGHSNTIGGTALAARNVISANHEHGIVIVNGSSNLIQGNLIGTDSSGSTNPIVGNAGSGVVLRDSSTNTIGGVVAGALNLISSNGADGILIEADQDTASNNLVLGNRSGTDITGTLAAGNGGFGIRLDGALETTVGGTTALAGNLASGNSAGIGLGAGPDNVALGNFIGTDVTGTTALGNRNAGLYGGTDSEIGGTVPGARNLISGNDEDGIALFNVQRPTILGNYIGTDVSGLQPLPNGENGIWTNFVTHNLTIGGTDAGAGNLISGNLETGVYLTGSSSMARVLGNLIGTDATGLVQLGNAASGVWTGGQDIVGGIEPGSRNVISGNGGFGVAIFGGDSNQVLGNFIGLDVTGTAAIGNGRAGVRIGQSNDNLIGGSEAGAGNVISGNATRGVEIVFQDPYGGLVENNRIQGNLIGTDVTGTRLLGTEQGTAVFSDLDVFGTRIGGSAPGAGNVLCGTGWGVDASRATRVLGNMIGVDISGHVPLGNDYGVRVSGDSRVGGSTPGAGNVISGNANYGIKVSGDNVSVEGNLIGTDAAGIGLIGNGGPGVVAHLISVGDVSVIGGAESGARNTIAGSGDSGIVILDGGVAVRGNSIHSNALLGIDLASDGVTPNDPQDPDTGANGLQNFPILTSVTATPSGVTIDGALNSLPGSTLRIEFFATASCDASGYGEGDRYLGSVDVTTNGLGVAPVAALLAAGASDDEAITATATLSDRHTSEFSPCIEAQCDVSVPFGQTVVAADENTLAWPVNASVRFARGDLGEVASYSTAGDTWREAVTSIDISFDHPAAGEGVYYLVRPLACGSWQTTIGGEPDRDTSLP